MRISDWSSDVCSSDLRAALEALRRDRMEKDLLIFRHLEERREFQRRMLEAKRSHEHEKREVETQTLPAKQERESLRAAFMKARRETIAPPSRGRDTQRDLYRSRHCRRASRA